MRILIVIMCMIFCHIVDDYYLQGWLASAKQKSYWEKNAPEEKYKYDYICALLMHSYSWTFMIMLPITIIYSFRINPTFLVIFMFNLAIHAIVDDFKANKKCINLWQDQIIHLCQIVGTAVALLL